MQQVACCCVRNCLTTLLHKICFQKSLDPDEFYSDLWDGAIMMSVCFVALEMNYYSTTTRWFLTFLTAHHNDHVQKRLTTKAKIGLLIR